MYYFASDMHLGASAGGDTRARERLLVEWLGQVAVDAEAVFLLGDVFDFWFEYKEVVPKGFTRTLGKLSELADRGVEVHFFPGNHDMWTSGYLEQECGVAVHRGTGIFELHGKRIFVAHGDDLGAGRKCGERFLSRFFRNRPAKWIFERAVHPDLALMFGHWWSRGSRKSHGEGYEFWGEREPLIRFARDFAARVPIDYFVFGHLHHKVDHPLGQGSRVILLGDWIARPSYAALTPDGELTLHDLP
ncbi:UDP-2,3-diacylglucosamine hydrolase [Bacteroidia bacterium]|nr:UDP-2,3-diacylglucosamine hydrolase [Bacteroidia bacterium]